MSSLDILPHHLKIVKSILKNTLSVDTTVWIFGSRVDKARKKYSDLDLLIDYHHQKMPDFILMALNESFDESDLPYKVDIVDWNAITDSFKKCITNKQQLSF